LVDEGVATAGIWGEVALASILAWAWAIDAKAIKLRVKRTDLFIVFFSSLSEPSVKLKG
jgi:hypothetical protein